MGCARCRVRVRSTHSASGGRPIEPRPPGICGARSSCTGPASCRRRASESGSRGSGQDAAGTLVSDAEKKLVVLWLHVERTQLAIEVVADGQSIAVKLEDRE